MTYKLCVSVTLALVSVTLPLRAANQSHAGVDSQDTIVWTHDDLEKVRRLGLISVVGRIDEEGATLALAPGPYVRTQDPEWYGAQAAKLSDELERRQTQLCEYRQALDDVRNVGNEILERHVNEAQAEINGLKDLARRHDIPPGVLRGQ